VTALRTPARKVGGDRPRRLVAEALGTAFLLAVIVGSGVMGERLAGGTVALALLANALATGAALVVLITVLGPVSGAHLNPAVTLVFLLRGDAAPATAAAYVLAQVAGAVLGVFAAHLMFGEPMLQLATQARAGPAQAFSEAVATFGLVVASLGGLRFQPAATPWLVGLYILAAYWFTASTSFANPAVTLARSLSDTFAGIAPASVAAFILAQLAGAGLATALCSWLFATKEPPP
jgi:glycerol uptake facilitator-like aquaporin